VGTPGKVREMLKAVVDMNVDLFLVRMLWANFTHERALRTMETFAKDVMPMFRDRESAR